ncbi:anaerobic ribonucleoside-triphosphate reductase activating protein [Lachnospiraceae bacterium MD308]|nr:anaerobic ribonucleoside-triphosphate reductase activating protein [Lachnospiraceae bacterium MD308]
MRYASIRSMDISNGEGIGVALFVQGCPFKPHCRGCFNPETWDFDGGKEWTAESKDKLIKLASRPYIKRLSILGGEPLANENLDGVLDLVNEIRILFPQKTIWLYSGYTWEQLFEDDKFDIEGGICENQTRRAIVLSTDVFIDGRYVDSQKDLTLKWRGSKNQKVIDVKKSIQQGEVVLWCN